MLTVYLIVAFIVVLAWLTHDSDGLDFRARDRHRAQGERDSGARGARGLLV
ncbi:MULTISPECIES: hypothetical protein [Tsukamurella]|uniref:Uncharacterized protein n=1 Tax=Tsukamurella strandjordii TaxID=147577 RepID=A0AA90SM23_9ACTN|nr:MULTISPECIES: hypothetical protein [Tsukamurella]MDP0398738.1 hypothetical protein [Tsukamurella strandjordii]GIZ99480.1 hypothetical protein TTY48_40920 [Tsukamurella sp. TY48]